MNIGPHASHLPSRLSIGEQQRASIARALVNKPFIILADEPTSALDDHHTEQVIELLQEQTHLEGASLIIVTHDARIKTFFQSNHPRIMKLLRLAVQNLVHKPLNLALSLLLFVLGNRFDIAPIYRE